MKKKTTATIGALMALVLGGCATSPVPLAEARPAPRDRILAFQAPIAGAASLVITRDSGLTGSNCYYAFSINRVLAARLKPGEVARFEVPPGEVLLKYGHDPQGAGLCRGDSSTWTQRETLLRPGETKSFRLQLDSDGRPDITRAD